LRSNQQNGDRFVKDRRPVHPTRSKGGSQPLTLNDALQWIIAQTWWDDAVVILRGEALALVNIERQVPRGGPGSCEHRTPGAAGRP
jgi:hypothetical protein